MREPQSFNLTDLINEDLTGNAIQDKIAETEDKLSKLIEENRARVVVYNARDAMEAGDMKAFENMLTSIDEASTLFLIIDSPGGDPETALRIIRAARRYSSFKTIIPDMAKSAATQVCLGSDEIWMGANSEIGPIGPKIRFRGSWVSATTILEGVDYIENKAKNNPDVPTNIYASIAQHYDPAKLREAEQAIDYIRNSASEIASQMFEEESDALDCIDELLKTEPHGKAIGIKQANNMRLNIRDLRNEEVLWSNIWEIYLRTEHVLDQGHDKVFVNKSDVLIQG